MNAVNYFIIFSKRSAFLKLSDVFPECGVLQMGTPQLVPLICLKENSCHVGKNCMALLVKRLNLLFQNVLPQVGAIYLYYRNHLTQGIEAGVFFRNLQDFKIIRIKKYMWEYLKKRGVVMQFSPGQDFFLPDDQIELKTSL